MQDSTDNAKRRHLLRLWVAGELGQCGQGCGWKEALSVTFLIHSWFDLGMDNTT